MHSIKEKARKSGSYLKKKYSNNDIHTLYKPKRYSLWWTGERLGEKRQTVLI